MNNNDKNVESTVLGFELKAGEIFTEETMVGLSNNVEDISWEEFKEKMEAAGYEQ